MLKLFHLTCMFKFSVHSAQKVKLAQWKFLIANGTKYSRIDQVKIVEDSLYQIWRGMSCFGRWYLFKFFEGSLPQILIGPFSKILPWILLKTCQNALKGLGNREQFAIFWWKTQFEVPLDITLSPKVRKSERPKDFKTWSHNSSKPYNMEPHP